MKVRILTGIVGSALALVVLILAAADFFEYRHGFDLWSGHV